MIFFKELKASNTFPVCYNLLPHYAGAEQGHSMLMHCVEEALADGRVQTFFLADRPVHPQKISSLDLARDILDAGGEPIVSLALTFDKRDEVTAKLQKYWRTGVRQFLFVTGDYPAKSENESAQPVFDLDSVQMLMLLNEPDRLKGHTDFLASAGQGIVKGCAVSPFKTTESEQVWQYEKLKRKISIGADFAITQLGYDLRKYDELLKFCALNKISVPLVANISATDPQTAQLIQEKNIPGIRMPNCLLSGLEETDSPSRAAKTLAVLQGLGYHGVLLGSGSADFSEIQHTLDEAAELQSGWQGFLDELNYEDSSFYYFQKDPQLGLNSSKPAPLTPKHFPYPLYSFSYFIDWLVYVPQGPLFKITGRFCHFCNDHRFWYSFIWLQEFLSKKLLYGCEMCGDCVLYACGFLCYRSGCPKKMANGPCGGSRDGYCEIEPDKTCFWVKVYKSMKGVRQHVTFNAPPIPARDTSLGRTCSWVNFFMGRDHRKMKQEGMK